MEQFYIVVNQVIIFLVTIIIGFLAFKFKLLKEATLPAITNLFFVVALPFQIFVKTIQGATREDLFIYWYLIPIQIAIFLVLVLLNKLVTRIFRMQGTTARCYMICSSFGCVGFIGIPMLLALYGAHSMIYLSILTIFDIVMVWTLGVSWSYPEDSEFAKIRFDRNTAKMIFSPPIIATLISFVFLMLNIHLPSVIEKTFDNIANASLPLPLLYIGGVLAFSDIKALFRRWETYIIMLTKMLLFPILLGWVLHMCHLSPELTGLFVVIMGIPSTPVAAMFARGHGTDETLALSASSITIAGSLITLPLVYYAVTVLGFV